MNRVADETREVSNPSSKERFEIRKHVDVEEPLLNRRSHAAPTAGAVGIA